MKYLLLSLVLLFGLSDVTFGQSRFEKYSKLLKEMAVNKERVKSGRQKLLGNMKNISKADYVGGKYKKLVVPYEEDGTVKTVVAEYKNGKYIRVIQIPRGQSKTINLNADAATYGYWKNKGWY
jgi:hypothetical protein